MVSEYTKCGKSALELLDSKKEIEDTILEKHGWKASFAFLGVMLASTLKWGLNRPLNSGKFLFNAFCEYINKKIRNKFRQAFIHTLYMVLVAGMLGK